MPSDFSVETYAIENGALVPASEETIAQRAATAIDASQEAVRQKREARYRSLSDPILFDAIEKLATQHPDIFSEWLTAKATVRTELPKA